MIWRTILAVISVTALCLALIFAVASAPCAWSAPTPMQVELPYHHPIQPSACPIASEQEFLDEAGDSFQELSNEALLRVVAALEAEGHSPGQVDRIWTGEANGTVLMIFVREGCVTGHATARLDQFLAVVEGRIGPP